MRRLVAALVAASGLLIVTAVPAGANVQKLVIKDPGFVQSGACDAGSNPCTDGPTNTAVIELAIKCPEGEFFELLVHVKQGDENQGQSQTGGDCNGSARQIFVLVTPGTGAFSPGKAKVKASALSSTTAGPRSTSGVFQANTDRRITLIPGSAGT
jgi:hypothetical protein